MSVKSKLVKFGGKLVRVSEMALNSLYYDAKTFRNYETFKKSYKLAKNNPSVKLSQFVPGGVKDPVRLAKEAAEYDAYRAKELTEKIQSRYGKDEFSQFKGKKKAEKMIGIFEGIKDIMMPSKTIRPFTNSELRQKIKQPLSKIDFWNILNDRPAMQKGSFLSDASEVAEKVERGGIGRKGIIEKFKQLKRSAKRVQREVIPQLPKAAPIDRMISAKGKGIRFIRKNGRIIPIRPKK